MLPIALFASLLFSLFTGPAGVAHADDDTGGAIVFHCPGSTAGVFDDHVFDNTCSRGNFVLLDRFSENCGGCSSQGVLGTQYTAGFANNALDGAGVFLFDGKRYFQADSDRGGSPFSVRRDNEEFCEFWLAGEYNEGSMTCSCPAGMAPHPRHGRCISSSTTCIEADFSRPIANGTSCRAATDSDIDRVTCSVINDSFTANATVVAGHCSRPVDSCSMVVRRPETLINSSGEDYVFVGECITEDECTNPSDTSKFMAGSVSTEDGITWCYPACEGDFMYYIDGVGEARCQNGTEYCIGDPLRLTSVNDAWKMPIWDESTRTCRAAIPGQDEAACNSVQIGGPTILDGVCNGMIRYDSNSPCNDAESPYYVFPDVSTGSQNVGSCSSEFFCLEGTPERGIIDAGGFIFDGYACRLPRSDAECLDKIPERPIFELSTLSQNQRVHDEMFNQNCRAATGHEECMAAFPGEREYEKSGMCLPANHAQCALYDPNQPFFDDAENDNCRAVQTGDCPPEEEFTRSACRPRGNCPEDWQRFAPADTGEGGTCVHRCQDHEIFENGSCESCPVNEIRGEGNSCSGCPIMNEVRPQDRDACFCPETHYDNPNGMTCDVRAVCNSNEIIVDNQCRVCDDVNEVPLPGGTECGCVEPNTIINGICEPGVVDMDVQICALGTANEGMDPHSVSAEIARCQNNAGSNIFSDPNSQECGSCVSGNFCPSRYIVYNVPSGLSFCGTEEQCEAVDGVREGNLDCSGMRCADGFVNSGSSSNPECTGGVSASHNQACYDSNFRRPFAVRGPSNPDGTPGAGDCRQATDADGGSNGLCTTIDPRGSRVDLAFQTVLDGACALPDICGEDEFKLLPEAIIGREEPDGFNTGECLTEMQCANLGGVADAATGTCRATTQSECGINHEYVEATSSALATCTPCEVNQVSTGGNACRACPVNATRGAGEDNCTECPINEVREGGVCTACPINMARASNEGICTACPIHTERLENERVCTECPLGQIRNAEEDECRPRQTADCEDGEYLDVINTCIAPRNAAECAEAKNPEGRTLYDTAGNVCVATCPDTHILNEGDNSCNPRMRANCPDNEEFVAGPVGGTCVQCVLGEISTGGADCRPRETADCEDGEYLDADNDRTCRAPRNAAECAEAKNPEGRTLYDTAGHVCVETCSDAHVQNENDCNPTGAAQCMEDAEFIEAENEGEGGACRQCRPSQVSSNGAACSDRQLADCADGEYLDEGNDRTCRAPENAAECAAAKNLEGHDIYDTTERSCIDECPVDTHVLEDADRSCRPRVQADCTTNEAFMPGDPVGGRCQLCEMDETSTGTSCRPSTLDDCTETQKLSADMGCVDLTESDCTATERFGEDGRCAPPQPGEWPRGSAPPYGAYTHASCVGFGWPWSIVETENGLSELCHAPVNILATDIPGTQTLESINDKADFCVLRGFDGGNYIRCDDPSMFHNLGIPSYTVFSTPEPIFETISTITIRLSDGSIRTAVTSSIRVMNYLEIVHVEGTAVAIFHPDTEEADITMGRPPLVGTTSSEISPGPSSGSGDSSDSSSAAVALIVVPAVLIGGYWILGGFNYIDPIYSLTYSGENDDIRYEARGGFDLNHENLKSYVRAIQSDGDAVAYQSGISYGSKIYSLDYAAFEDGSEYEYDLAASINYGVGLWSISPTAEAELNYQRSKDEWTSDAGAGLTAAWSAHKWNVRASSTFAGDTWHALDLEYRF